MPDSGRALGVDDFIARWSTADGGERANYSLFLTELCDVIGAPKPDPAHDDDTRNAYVFERRVPHRRIDGPTTTNYIDLYKRGCFVLEAKQSRKRQEVFKSLQFALGDENHRPRGRQWDTMMKNAREQAENYAKRLPAEEGWPPFLIVCDVGNVLEVYADFSLQGKHYAQFPDRQSFRIGLEDLQDADTRIMLRTIWTDPASLNPATRSAAVTRDIAAYLARLSKALETRLLRQVELGRGTSPDRTDRSYIAEQVSTYLMRCLFTMFAEDIGLLQKDSFKELLESYRGKARNVHRDLERLWNEMDTGGFSTAIRQDIKRFNGGLFKDARALEIDEDDLDLLIKAAGREWHEVEPAIFGTLLEQALDPRERHRLGAHYTPRPYVERLVVATIIEPLRDEWKDARAVATQLWDKGDHAKARDTVKDYHRKLCEVRVLDPACGTGNFLYVAMELMKRLEGEVLENLVEMGETQDTLDLDRHTVGVQQFLGLEINPRAVAIAELVLWIGYLQWHFRTRGKAMPTEPVLKSYRNIRQQDAILDHDDTDILRDVDGHPVSRWDGVTYKLNQITGEEIPDESATVELLTYQNPRPASWPDADFIVGNPPFIGGKDMRRELGDGYAEACWKVRKHIPGGADYVMHFWDTAAEIVRNGKAKRFGFITTNSITQTFSRRVIDRHLKAKKPLSLLMAIPDHPWIKSADTAAVRIAMTVGVPGTVEGHLRKVIEERDINTDAPVVAVSDNVGRVHADFTTGTDLGSVLPLRSNARMSNRGVVLHGAGFLVTPTQAIALGLNSRPGLERHIRKYANGRDLADKSRGLMAIDLFGLQIEEVERRFPEVYQWLLDRVKPERDHNNRESRRKYWWLFGEPISTFRPVLDGIPRFIATVETSKHRFFQFLDDDVLPDNKLLAIGLDDAFALSVLSSRIHYNWYLGRAGRIGVYDQEAVYVKTQCFDPFPFPDPPAALRAEIADLGERLDAHRKAVMARHDFLTMTKMYNVLEAVRAGTPLSDAERDIYEAGLIGVLRDLHDRIDAKVAEAYGWSPALSDDAILSHVVALNRDRAAEEATGLVRWLRPSFQAPDEVRAAARAQQVEADLAVVEDTVQKPAFPRHLPDRVREVRALLAETPRPITALDLARQFRQGRSVEPRVEEVLRTLALLGQAESIGERYVLNG